MKNKLLQIPLYTRETYDYILNDNPAELSLDEYSKQFGLTLDENGEFKMDNFRNLINLSLTIANRIASIDTTASQLYVVDKNYITFLKEHNKKHSESTLSAYLSYMDLNNKNTEYKFKKENFFSHFLVYYYPMIAVLRPKQKMLLSISDTVRENIKQHLSKFINKKNIYIHNYCFLLERSNLLVTHLKNCAENYFKGGYIEKSSFEKEYAQNGTQADIAINLLVPIVIKVPKIPIFFKLKDYENSLQKIRQYNYYSKQKYKEYTNATIIDKNIGSKYNNIMKSLEKDIYKDIFTPYTISQYYSFPYDLESCFYEFNPDVNIYFTNSLSTVDNVISNIDIFLSKI